MAKHFKYFDRTWRTESFACQQCGWSGPAAKMVRELYEALMDFSCPRCDTIVLIIGFPTTGDVIAASESGNVEAKEMMGAVNPRGGVENLRKIEAPTAQQKAAKTAKWARIMAKWLVTYSRRRGAKWQLVEFGGPTGAESRGIVDLLAVRKDHREMLPGTKRGDLLEIVVIQSKGGSSRRPTPEDIARLRAVSRHHRAKAVVLATWRRGTELRLQRLDKGEWASVTPDEIFG